MNMNDSQRTWRETYERRQAQEKESLAKIQRLHELRAQMDQAAAQTFKDALGTHPTPTIKEN